MRDEMVRYKKRMGTFDQPRQVAVACGQEVEFDRIVAAIRTASLTGDLVPLDEICDSLIPNIHAGMAGTFLPSFAMTGLPTAIPRVRQRAAWRRLRDRVFSTMDSLRGHPGVTPSISAMIDAWFSDNAAFSREADAPLN